MQQRLILKLWLYFTRLTYRQGYGWSWMQQEVEKIASNENYKAQLKRNNL